MALQIKRYKLSLDIDFYGLEIAGYETIILSGAEKNLVLDSSGLEITGVASNGKSLPYSLDREADKLVIQDVAQDISREISVDISYHGRVSEDSLHGIYKSKYDGGYLVATDLEPNGARLVFPCMDDPKFKAEFDLEVTTQSGLVVSSNSTEKEVVRMDDKRSRHVFERTPPMSTYLFYLGVGNFDSLTLSDKGIEFRALARQNYATKGRYALEHATKFLHLYQEYYSTPYPLPKLDLVALPEYPAGAMENWGAITFRESSLLVDENASTSNRKNVVATSGHEIAHQWFGDLVTMKWWNDLWLNESFATFMESKMTDTLHPEWNVVGDFLQHQSGDAMMGDALVSTHPIDVDVKAPKEIGEIFDEISYGKGASILRMIESWIGEDAFRVGIRQYLSEFSYGNATGSDLWKNLERSSGMPVSDVMSAWIKQPGYPVVRVSADRGTVHFTQERFLLGKSAASSEEVWPIPIISILKDAPVNFLMRQKSMDISISDPVSKIRVNIGAAGFYRVLYDRNLYSILEAEFPNLPSFDRWGVISDLFAFLIADKIESNLYFDFLRIASEDSDYLILDTIASELGLLRSLGPDSKLVMDFYLDYYRKQMQRLTLEPKSGENENDRILRGRIATGLALEDQAFAAKLSERFAEYDRLDPDLRTAVAVAYAQYYKGSSFSGLVATMKRMGTEVDVIKILFALTCYDDPALVERSLDFSISGQVGRGDSLFAVYYAARNPRVRKTTWEWLTKNLDTLREIFRGTGAVPSMLEEVISLSGIGRERQVRDYISTVRIEEAQRSIVKGLELMDAYSDLARRLTRTI